MSNNNEGFKALLAPLAAALVPHLAELLVEKLAHHLNAGAPAADKNASTQSLADIAAADAAAEDARAAAADTGTAATDEAPKRGRRRGAGATADEKAAADTAEKSAADKAAEPAADAAPAPRRRRKPADDAPADKIKDKLIADNAEQAALRQQLIVDLDDLADIEEAHKKVYEALQRVGSGSINEVATGSLETLAEDIDALIAEYFPEEDETK